MATPISFPIPKVMAAAASPNMTCRMPECQILLPVKSVMAAPITNKPIALAAALIRMAVVPLRNIKGNTGMMAPMAKSIIPVSF